MVRGNPRTRYLFCVCVCVCFLGNPKETETHLGGFRFLCSPEHPDLARTPRGLVLSPVPFGPTSRTRRRPGLGLFDVPIEGFLSQGFNPAVPIQPNFRLLKAIFVIFPCWFQRGCVPGGNSFFFFFFQGTEANGGTS